MVQTTLAMYALQLASGRPSALVDWNNYYGGEEDRCILFHCGNWPRIFFSEAGMDNAEILATLLGTENTYGTVSGSAMAGPMTYARITTDDHQGRIRAYVGEGRISTDPLATSGSRAVAEMPHLQKLMQHICWNGFEHHAAMSGSQTASTLAEAFGRYLGWEIYHHR